MSDGGLLLLFICMFLTVVVAPWSLYFHVSRRTLGSSKENRKAVTENKKEIKEKEDERGKESREALESFRNLSEGARRLLSVYDDRTETGYYQNLAYQDIPHSYIMNYMNNPLKAWAQLDLSTMRMRNKHPHVFSPEEREAEALSTERLTMESNVRDFDLSEITDSEWDLIVKKYMDFMNKFQSTELKAIEAASKAQNRSEKMVKHIGYVEEALAEARQLGVSENNDADEWDSEFEQLESSAKLSHRGKVRRFLKR